MAYDPHWQYNTDLGLYQVKLDPESDWLTINDSLTLQVGDTRSTSTVDNGVVVMDLLAKPPVSYTEATTGTTFYSIAEDGSITLNLGIYLVVVNQDITFTVDPLDRPLNTQTLNNLGSSSFNPSFSDQTTIQPNTSVYLINYDVSQVGRLYCRLRLSTSTDNSNAIVINDTSEYIVLRISDL